MKKLLFFIVLIGLALSSCNKPENLVLEQDVIFKAVAFESGFKSDDDICSNDIAHYAILDIQPIDENGDAIGSSEQKTVDIFYLNNTMYTNTLKLDPGTFELTSFLLMNYGPDDLFDGGDDVIVYASPDEGSFNSQIVQGLPIEFSVSAFMKNEVNIEVLCFKDVDYTDFGFSWFTIDFTIVENDDLVFFGDFCTKYFEDYEANQYYAGQTGDLNHDMVAIFEIEIFKGETSLGSYNNESWFGEGEPLIIPNPDDPEVDNEEFKFVLSILVKVGDNFEYKEFYTWNIIDNAPLPNIGEDNVMDFVLGSCVPDADLILPPYMNLPETVTMAVGPALNPGTAGTYIDILLSDFGNGYDIITDSTYGAFCGDLETGIETISYNVEVFSSLYPGTLVETHGYLKFGEINWIGNNLYRFPDHTWQDIQNAVWMLIGQLPDDGTDGGVGVPSQIAKDMKDAAIVSGVGYFPPVGGWAAVLFVSPEATPNNPVIQILFILVDP